MSDLRQWFDLDLYGDEGTLCENGDRGSIVDTDVYLDGQLVNGYVYEIEMPNDYMLLGPVDWRKCHLPEKRIRVSAWCHLGNMSGPMIS